MSDDRPLVVLGRTSAETVEAFSALRRSVTSAGPLDPATCELVLIGALASTGDWGSFRTHVRRAIDLGVGELGIRHAVVVTLAASACLDAVVTALREIDALADVGAPA